MNLEELKAAWEVDCHIDELHIDTASAQTPHLHAKYLNELIQYKLKLAKTQLELLAMRALKTRYYKGELTKEELEENGWQQWQYRTLKSEIDGLLEADSDVQTQLGREAYIKTIVFFLESVLSELRSRSFHCKNILEWVRFRAGN